MREEAKKKNHTATGLVLCLCVMALTSLFAVKSSIDKVNESADMSNVTQSAESLQENAEAAARTPVVDSNDSAQDGEAAEYMMPLDGKVQQKYAMDSLVYWKTLDQYMTHPGTDIHAGTGAKVKAVSDGTVTRIYNDDRYGITVEISHKNGLTSCYSNLAEKVTVETGDEVKQGHIIGHVGDTSHFESLEETHLHFAMSKDGEPVDPGDYIKGLK